MVAPEFLDGDRGLQVTIHNSNGLTEWARRALPIGMIACVVVGAAGSIAVGQITGEGVRPDNIEVLESSRPILEYIIAGVCIFGSLAIGFKSSNRAHGT